MQLVVEFYAGLRERAGLGEVVIEGLPDTLDVSGLKVELQEKMPELGSLEHVTAVIGTEYVSDTHELSEGVRVSLLPPVSGGEVTDAELSEGLFLLTGEPLQAADAQQIVEHKSCGAVVVFTGNVRERNRGEDVTRIEYEALERMAGPEMARIFEGVRADHGDPSGADAERALRMYCAHRMGSVEVGEPSVVIAVASPHREAAFEAARALIDRLKERLPVWKKELYADGHHWIGEGS
jgi:molybdopterin synthase catalytic subunit